VGAGFSLKNPRTNQTKAPAILPGPSFCTGLSENLILIYKLCYNTKMRIKLEEFTEPSNKADWNICLTKGGE